MRHEDLASALVRAREAARPFRERHEPLREAVAAARRRQSELEKSPRSEAADEYRENAARLYGMLVEASALAARLKAAQDLEHALQYLPHEWKVAMPGCGLFGARFFVRSYRIEEGKPAAYDPFWIDACTSRGGEEADKALARHAVWVSGGDLRPGGSGPSDPLLPVRKPFGPAEEASRAPCPACGGEGYVVGFKEFTHWTEDDDWPYLQTLSVLCLACPRLELMAERRDLPAIKLHP